MDFKGFEKVGMDTSALLILAVPPSNLEDFKNKFFPAKTVFYHAAKVHHEIIGVLINNFYFDEEDAKKEWKRLAEELNLNIVYWHKKFKEELEDKVRLANQQAVLKSGNRKLKIGEPDIKIISCFLNEGVNKVYTLDKGFEATCLELGIDVLKLPREYLKKSGEIRSMNKKVIEESLK
ncbi:hypothetical protein A3K73_06105 [Candidatus Pacearchaeota archaeon RBG_13_36_9]|nr:MAG: hypothetical protein A3K73_06105 [Candidatus Pacearchaeota archaeon RBG_13_36_9]